MLWAVALTAGAGEVELEVKALSCRTVPLRFERLTLPGLWATGLWAAGVRTKQSAWTGPVGESIQ